MILKKKINTLKILFFTLIYKYLFCYIFLFLLLCFSSKYIDCKIDKTNIYYYFHYLNLTINLINLVIVPILTLINIILILINIYNFNKINNNNKNNKYLNKIKKINKYELLIIISCFILLISNFIIVNLFENNFYNLIIFVILIGFFPISTLELLFYFENKKPELTFKVRIIR